jgi:hypothetical protein
MYMSSKVSLIAHAHRPISLEIITDYQNNCCSDNRGYFFLKIPTNHLRVSCVGLYAFIEHSSQPEVLGSQVMASRGWPW